MTYKPTESEDLLLIRKAQEGDERAFTKLVKNYEDLVYRFAFKMCRDQEKAEEAFQDTFVNVYRKLKQFDNKSKFSTWIYKIVANNCLMKRRRSKLDQASISIHEPEGFMEVPPLDGSGHVIQTIPSWKDSPLEGVVRKELRETLDGAIGKLPPDYRAVFVLRDVEGQSAEETSKILDLSVPAVKSRLHRARAFLREELNEYMKQ
ncbi:MAG: sigma-70 family RNA polymerase sigma factor [Bacteroidota bacterium]